MHYKTRTILFGVTVLLGIIVLSGCDFTQYIAHYAFMSGWTTKINIQNPNSTDVDVDLYIYDNNGNQVTNTTVTVPADGFLKSAVQDLFTDDIPSTGSIKIVSHEPSTISKVSAIVLFEYSGGPSMGGLKASKQTAKVLHFPWFQNDSVFNTGIAILNVNDYPIEVLMRAVANDGTKYLSNTVRLQPMQRIIGYPGDFFPMTIPENADLSVYASGKVAGFIILHNNSISKVEAINGEPQIPFQPDFFAISDTNLDLHCSAGKMIVSPDGAYIYMNTVCTSHLMVIDAINKTLLHDIDSFDATDIALSADGKYLLCADFDAGQIYKVSTSDFSYSPFASITKPLKVATSNDGRYLGVVSSDRYIIYDLDTGTPSIEKVGLSDLVNCMFTQDSKYFVSIDRTDKKLYAMNLNSFVEKETNLTYIPRSIAQNPNPTGNINIVIGNENDKVTFLAYPSFTESSYKTTGNYHPDVEFSPDGRYLYIVSQSDHSVWIWDSYANDFKDTLDTTNAIKGLGIAPEGDRAYFVDQKLKYIDGLPISAFKMKQK